MSHEKYEGQDDGEYHFSDDQANYDVEPEVAQAAPVATGGSAAAQYRKPVLGLLVFGALIFMVYKILAPSSPQSTADFSQAAPMRQAAVAPARTVKPVAPVETANNNASAMAPSMAPVMTKPVESTPIQSTPAAIAPSMVNTQIATAPTMQASPSIASPTSSNTSPFPTTLSAVTEKLSSLQAQNGKLQAEYEQKQGDLETQNAALQGKLQDLNTRITGLETAITRLGQLIQDTRGNNKPANVMAAPSSQTAAPRTMNEPKAAYTVQAIIPGRAWLKSEAGDTVTVAEGDALKDYGRIVKIDPYDGIVQIDTGNKMISLSYGNSGD